MLNSRVRSDETLLSRAAFILDRYELKLDAHDAGIVVFGGNVDFEFTVGSS